MRGLWQHRLWCIPLWKLTFAAWKNNFPSRSAHWPSECNTSLSISRCFDRLVHMTPYIPFPPLFLEQGRWIFTHVIWKSSESRSSQESSKENPPKSPTIFSALKLFNNIPASISLRLKVKSGNLKLLSALQDQKHLLYLKPPSRDSAFSEFLKYSIDFFGMGAASGSWGGETFHFGWFIWWLKIRHS